MFIQSFIHSFKRGHQYSAAVWMRILHLFNKQTGLKECADSLELFFFSFQDLDPLLQIREVFMLQYYTCLLQYLSCLQAKLAIK